MSVRWKLILEYDGTGFVGWSRQRGLRSIQGEVEGVLERLLQHPVQLDVSGRTDAGVHALGQVAAFTTDKIRSPNKMRIGLNALLPPEIACVQAIETTGDFHPRFWSRSKKYRYTWLTRPSRSPLRRNGVWHIYRELDVEAMSRAAAFLVGEHDFSSFRAQGCQARHANRIVQDISVNRNNDEVFLDVYGHGFLRHMVRIIAGSLFEVGRGRKDAGWIEEVLQGKDRTKAGRTAPANGLCLMHVEYEDCPPPWFRADEHHVRTE
jgi:tRNA pseudouridine38-40 synthase